MKLHEVLTVIMTALMLLVPAYGQMTLSTRTGTVPGVRFGQKVRPAGDVNNDGVADFIVAAPGTHPNPPGYVEVISGAGGGVLHRFTGTSSFFGKGVGGIGDVNGDGFDDLLVGDLYQVTIRSGATGGVLRVINAPSGTGEYISDDVVGLGDVNGDGIPDLATTASNNGNARAWSGATGALLWTTPTGIYNDDPALANVGDGDGDGKNDLAVGDFGNGQNGAETGRVTIISGATGFVVRSVYPSAVNLAPRFGWAVAALGDFNGDNVPDFAVGALEETDPASGVGSGAVYVISGANGAILRHWFGGLVSPSRFGGSVALAGDLDSDGVKDVAVGAPSNQDPAHIRVLSGATGAELMRIDDTVPASFGASMCSVEDVNGDGFGDFAVGAPGYTGSLSSQGRVQVVSGRLMATVTPLGTGCGGGPFLPTLGGTRPILGFPATIVGERMPTGSFGLLVVSLPPSMPTSLGFLGCVAWIDLSAFGQMPVVPGSNNTWSVSLPVPLDPTLAGVRFVFQAVYIPTTGPLGFDLSNGLLMRLGY